MHILLKELKEFEIEKVIAKGSLLAEDGKLVIEIPSYEYPEDVKHSVNLGRELGAEDFVLRSNMEGQVEVNVIGIIETQAPTNHLTIEMEVIDGELRG